MALALLMYTIRRGVAAQNYTPLSLRGSSGPRGARGHPTAAMTGGARSSCLLPLTVRRRAIELLG